VTKQSVVSTSTEQTLVERGGHGGAGAHHSHGVSHHSNGHPSHHHAQGHHHTHTNGHHPHGQHHLSHGPHHPHLQEKTAITATTTTKKHPTTLAAMQKTMNDMEPHLLNESDDLTVEDVQEMIAIGAFPYESQLEAGSYLSTQVKAELHWNRADCERRSKYGVYRMYGRCRRNCAGDDGCAQACEQTAVNELNGIPAHCADVPA